MTVNPLRSIPTPVPPRARTAHGIIGLALLLAVSGPLLPHPASAQQTNPPDARDFAAFKLITDRNIFDPNRRPHLTAQQRVQTVVDSFSLTGTFANEKGWFAVFDGTTPDYHKVLPPGGGIAGYVVNNIRQNGVRLVMGTNEMELTVGMQMRRDEDGRWSSGEPADSRGYSGALESSSRRGSRRGTESKPGAPAAGAPAETAEAPSPDAQSPDASVAVPEPPSGDPNDPVVRMMQRRAQELNGNENRNSNP
jgi:hypothetical protein